MSKRLLDLLVSFGGLVLASPVLLPVMFLVWWQDRHSPFYVASRVGLDQRPFRMVKLRSMRIGADRSGVDSTSAGDSRITPVGHFIRRYKLDELTQLWNVLIGDMSLVGPRPNVERETRLYTDLEQRLLTVKPGITDYASIVFADEGEILQGQADPDLAYNQLIRPWKSRLGLFYIERRSLALDLKLVLLTAVTILSREKALRAVAQDLERRSAPPELVRIAQRRDRLVPHPPPGASSVVTSRAA
ncbi:MAG: sugar transferase [Chromatiales bacterium]|nr:sugar transferase [Chromatiales bacterium]